MASASAFTAQSQETEQDDDTVKLTTQMRSLPNPDHAGKEGEEQQSDRISQLPDNLLVKILNRLIVKDAARTSILSTRWRNAWKSLEELDFDGSNELRAFYDRPGRGTSRNRLFRAVRKRYSNWVNRVVAQLQTRPTTIRNFRISFDLTNNCNSEGNIDRWIEFAISKRVESLHLAFQLSPNPYKEQYNFSKDCYNHIKTPVGISQIECLRSLRLSAVNVRGEILEHIFANCPLLEELVVKWSTNLREVAVVGPPRVKRLELRGCRWLERLEIDRAPSLASLVTYQCAGRTHSSVEVKASDCSCLVDLTIGIYWSSYESLLTSSPGCVSQLKSLSIYTSEEGWSRRDVARHTRLERLSMHILGSHYRSILRWMWLINACPRLHTLQFFFHSYPNRDIDPQWELGVMRTRRESIKVVEIVGFSGEDMDNKSVEYVMDCFVGLERIVLDRRLPTPYSCEDEIQIPRCGPKRPKISSIEIEERERVAKKMALKFKSRARPSVEFVVI